MSDQNASLASMRKVCLLAAAVVVPMAGIGAAVSFWRDAPGGTQRSGGMSIARSGADDDLARLKDYTQSIDQKAPVTPAAKGDLLPDVNTMIERLAARLERAPQDIKGWQMLGWSYFNTGLYEQAASAYARAVALDPNSAELKRSYEMAKAKTSGGASPETTSSAQTASAGKAGTPSTDQMTKTEAAPPHENDAAIRAMVDGLAHRLESSPRDVEGWARLLRSRVVLGETDAAATALRKALEIFKDDPAASDRIRAAAGELGLKTQ